MVRVESGGNLKEEILNTFADVPRLANAPGFVIQLKVEEWGGKFVDLRDDQVIPDRSVLNVIPQVGLLHTLIVPGVYITLKNRKQFALLPPLHRVRPVRVRCITHLSCQR